MRAELVTDGDLPYLPLAVDDPQPMYQQLADRFRSAIMAGELAPGQRLPSESDLRRQYGVSRTCIRTAVAQLRHEGLIVTRQGIGSHVRLDSTPRVNDSAAALTRIHEQLDTVIERIAAIEHMVTVAVGPSDGDRHMPPTFRCRE